MQTSNASHWVEEAMPALFKEDNMVNRGVQRQCVIAQEEGLIRPLARGNLPTGHPLNNHRTAATIPVAVFDGEDDKSIARLCPWVRAAGYEDSLRGIHEEVLHFEQYITQRDYEKRMCERVLSRLRSCVLQLRPKATIQTYGSYATNLMLPTSDVDVVVISAHETGDKSEFLRQLLKCLIDGGVARTSNSRVVFSHICPIVKYTDIETGCNVDVSINTQNSDTAVDVVKGFLKEYESRWIRPLVMFTKQLVLMKDLNDVYTGGISSYALVFFWVSYFQTHDRFKFKNSTGNIGIYLLEFFELYSRVFNFQDVGIRLTATGVLFPKPRENFKPITIPNFTDVFLEDPVNDQNNISSGSYFMHKVLLLFEETHKTLAAGVKLSMVHPSDVSHLQAAPSRSSVMNSKLVPSHLTSVVAVSECVDKHRKLMAINFSEFDVVPVPLPVGTGGLNSPCLTPWSNMLPMVTMYFNPSQNSELLQNQLKAYMAVLNYRGAHDSNPYPEQTRVSPE